MARSQKFPVKDFNTMGGEELSPPFHFGDGPQSALMPSILDKAFKGFLQEEQCPNHHLLRKNCLNYSESR